MDRERRSGAPDRQSSYWVLPRARCLDYDDAEHKADAKRTKLNQRLRTASGPSLPRFGKQPCYNRRTSIGTTPRKKRLLIRRIL